MKQIVVLLSALAVCGFANAAAADASGASDLPLVVFFGGHGSTAANMQRWQKAAAAKCGGHFNFVGLPYPAKASPDRSSVESNGREMVADTAAKLNDIMKKNPNQRVVIVGHSSGSALSDMVAAKIADPTRAQLVSLDGFHPSLGLMKKMSTQCWSTKQGGLKSNNYGTQQAACGENFRVFSNDGCRSRMCMHFRLVNTNVDPDLAGGQSSHDPDHGYAVKGYSNLSVNLSWLGKEACTSGAQPPPPKPQVVTVPQVRPQPPVISPPPPVVQSAGKTRRAPLGDDDLQMPMSPIQRTPPVR